MVDVYGCVCVRAVVSRASPPLLFVVPEFSMGEVDVIGFDYDYTLANYTERLPNLVYDLAMSYLVTERRYPGELIASGCPKYDPDFACRGTCACVLDRHCYDITHASCTVRLLPLVANVNRHLL